ncbi:MAG: DNRLRE domain-containing protein [Spirochaetales bacterium]|nr:DNRLRE domain-containing protein [Spirochaetales bacterium]
MKKKFALLIILVCFTTLCFPEQIVLKASKDSIIYNCTRPGYEEDANKNYGTSPILRIWNRTHGGYETYMRSLISFDFSSIPAGAAITDAKLYLYGVDHYNYTISGNSGYKTNACWVRRITSPWSESTVTWNTMPQTTDNHRVSIPDSTSPTQNYVLNVTALVKDILNNRNSDGFHLMLKVEQHYARMVFASREHEDSSRHPKLVISCIGNNPAFNLSGFPFTLENIGKAYSRLYGTKKYIDPTHLYLRFLPATNEQLETLHNMEFELFNDLIDPGDDSPEPVPYYDDFTWKYVIIPVNYTLPDITFEILAPVYIPGDTELELEEMAFIVSDQQDPNDPFLKSTKRKYKPSGQILYALTSVGNVGLENVTVKVRNWLGTKKATTRTDKDGYFEIQTEFRWKVRFVLVFENNHYEIRSLNLHLSDLDLMIRPAQKAIGVRAKTKTYTVNDDNELLWVWATIAHHIENYHNHCAEEGLPTPLKLKITAHGANTSGNASAPMLGRMYASSPADVGLIEGITNKFIITADISHMFDTVMTAVGNFLPDITYKFDRNDPPDAQEIALTIYHELGHSSHYQQAGNDFWVDYIQYIVKNNGYGSPACSDFERIALSEAWGYHCGTYFADLDYHNDYKIRNSMNNLENYNPASPYEPYGWIPKGVLLDMIDTSNESSPVRDRVNGYTMAQFYSCLTKDIDTPCKFMNKLYNMYTNTTRENLPDLFNQYTYDCPPVSNPDFRVTITGPTVVYGNQKTTWNSKVEGASGQISYQWSITSMDTSQVYFTGTASSISAIFPDISPLDDRWKVMVEASDGHSTSTYFKYIFVVY